MSMVLDVNGERQVLDPGEAAIREAVRQTGPFRSFLVLSKTDLTYLQCSGDAQTGFDLEYQEDAVDRHYRARREDFDVETIIAKFAAYARGDDSWRDGVEWEPFTF